ncbi:hypothetical protein ACF07S_17570 [Streptomyces sp. NPDC016640]|uniref:hypothetical protein n=1 Tax=Streptomyces sp. NPDC016640 TaxID=3364969 RepID=UPI0036FB2CF5
MTMEHIAAVRATGVKTGPRRRRNPHGWRGRPGLQTAGELRTASPRLRREYVQRIGAGLRHGSSSRGTDT